MCCQEQTSGSLFDYPPKSERHRRKMIELLVSETVAEMTFITTWANKTTFIMLGDLLLSKSTPGNIIDLPARFDAAFPVTNPQLSGLSQKVILLSPAVAVAWAGSYAVARSLVLAIADAIRSLLHRSKSNALYFWICG